MRSLAEAICTLIKSIQKSWYYLIFDCLGPSIAARWLSLWRAGTTL